MAIASRFGFFVKIRSPATFEFGNTIPAKADIYPRLSHVGFGPRADAAVILKPSKGVSERDTFSKPWYVERWNEGVIYVETVLEEVDGR